MSVTGSLLIERRLGTSLLSLRVVIAMETDTPVNKRRVFIHPSFQQEGKEKNVILSLFCGCVIKGCPKLFSVGCEHYNKTKHLLQGEPNHVLLLDHYYEL
jgi:hypothetical protein